MTTFTIEKAVRKKIYTKLALMSPSGGGKTYSSLRIATGMAAEIEKITGKKAKIMMANTEAERGYYYANEFNYDIVNIEAPHNPEKYVDLINFAVQQGYDILIIDSSSHEWEGKGGCLELQQQAGGTYQSWAKVTPRHNKFIEAIASSPIHIIATMRGKDQYELEKDERGKTNVKKLGVGAKQRDGFEYEFTCTFLIDQQTNMAKSQKDNTHIFEKDPETILTEEHGRKIIQWANSGDVPFEPVKREETASATEDLASIQENIVKLCVELGGTGNEQLMSVLKQYSKNGNPKAIKELDKAKECYENVKALKGGNE